MNPEPSPSPFRAESAVCERHPLNLATITCARCGRFACSGCEEWNAQVGRICSACAPLSVTMVRAVVGQRFLANLLDGLVLALSVMPLAAGMTLVPETERLLFGLSLFGGIAVIGAGLLVQLWLVCRGQSIGKRWQRIRVVRRDGSRASVARILLLRNLLPNVIGAFITYFTLVDILFIFGTPRRCLHDLFADTIVVDAS